MEQSKQFRPPRAARIEPTGTVEKAIDVLFCLHAAGGSLGVTAIGRELGAPKSSVHRLLCSLERRALVERDDGGRYRLGTGLLALGLGLLDREPVVVAARPVLEAHAEQVGETFFLVAARAGSLVVLEKAEGNGILRAAPRVGAKVPVHATAAGKLYLAFAPELLMPTDAVRSPAPELFTPATLRDEATLARAVEEARRQGFACNREEWIPGLCVLAAPVRAAGRMWAVVALAVPSARVAELGEEHLVERVRAAAGRVEARLSGARDSRVSDAQRSER
jgi:DNA-binding IclR family transcriptional regulator